MGIVARADRPLGTQGLCRSRSGERGVQGIRAGSDTSPAVAAAWAEL